MNSAKPIFLFAFANDKEQSLRLGDEANDLRDILAPAHDQRRLEVIQLGFATLDGVYRSFNRFHDRIALFHYGGHSNHSFLKLEDADARSAALSTLIGQQRNLRLVFLNGCANQEQVRELFQRGVPAVIATRSLINDRHALTFSKQFYEALAGGKSIREAFDAARSLLMNKSDAPPIDYYWDIPEGDQDDCPWGLYAQDEAALDWILPASRPLPQASEFDERVPIGWPEMNKELVQLAFAGMAALPGKGSYQALYQSHLSDPSLIPFNVLQNILLDAFPTMLSVQIRDLFTSEGKTQGRIRLREFDEAYDTLARLLGAIALANLWDAAATRLVNEEDRLDIPDSCRRAIAGYLSWTPESGPPTDQLWLVNEIGFVFERNGVTPCVGEIRTIAEHLRGATDFFRAYNFFEVQLRTRLLANDIPSREVEDLCRQAEHHYGLLLRHCAFLCSYQLVTVKVISVDMPRQVNNPAYVYEKAILKGRDYATIDTEPLLLQNVCSNNSVFITENGDLRELGLQLNLSPFLIDQNAFKAKESYLPKLYFFDGIEGEKIFFLHADTTVSDFTVTPTGNDPAYHNIDSLFEVFSHFQRDIGLPVF